MNITRINSLLLRLKANGHRKDRGAEGMVTRKAEAVQILKELNALNSVFRYRLTQAQVDLSRATGFLKEAA